MALSRQSLLVCHSTLIMARNKSSVIEDLMVIAARLPWQVGVGLAVVSYFLLHYFATQAPLTTNPTELKAMGKTLGDSMVHGAWTMLAGILQYLLPLVFAIGAGISALRSRGRKDSTGIQLKNGPSCPKCGSTMIRRTAKQGNNAGNSFWGCTNYPACRGIVNE